MKIKSMILTIWWVLYDITIKHFVRQQEFINTVGHRDSWIALPIMFRRQTEEDTITENKRNYKIECIENGWKEI